MKYADIPMTDYALAEPQEGADGAPGWQVTRRDGSQKWVAHEIFHGAIHKNLKLEDYKVQD